VADGVAGTWSRAQAKARDHVVGQHGAMRLRFLCGVRPGWAGDTAVLLTHAAGILRAPVAAPFSQHHHASGHLHPLLRDVRGMRFLTDL
jgi:hypothetical protein